MSGRAVVPIGQIGQRMTEQGRIRIGVKTERAMKAIDTFRFTSQDPEALEQIAVKMGGAVKPFSDPKSTDTFEVITTANECQVVLPADPLGDTPLYRMYGGGGPERKCDGETCEQWRSGPDGPEPYDVACPCLAAGELSCDVTTMLSVMLPFVRFGGTWRIVTKSTNAAKELPGMVSGILGLQQRGMPYAVLRIQERVEVHAGQTRKFKVPVLGVPFTPDEIAEGKATLGALPAAPAAELTPPAPAELTERVERGDVELVTPQASGGEGDASPAGRVVGDHTTESPTPSAGTYTLADLRTLLSDIPGMAEGKALKRARDIARTAGVEMPSQFDEIGGGVLDALCAELNGASS